MGVKGDLHNIPLLLDPLFLRVSDGEIFNREDQIGQFTFIGDDFPLFQYLVGDRGFEPLTPSTSMKCSSQLS